MIRFILSALLIIGFLSPLAGHATAAYEKIEGEGIANCDEFKSEPEKEDARVSWVLDYQRTINLRSSPDEQAGEKIDMKPIAKAWLRNWCGGRSKETLVRAAIAFHDDIVRREHRDQ